MIFDSISNKENYKEEKEIYQTLNFLEKLKKWDDVESNAIIQKDWISANPVSFLSKDESECMYEAHRKHIDVHYIMEGIEKIATADVKNLQEKVPFDKDKDIGFYEGCESGSYLLKTGDFMVCFPSDAHKVGMFKVFPTNYLAMKYSDDEGDNWSDLNIVSTFKPEESKFLVLGPGIGKQITTGENAGRLIVPLYSKSSAELGFMYSDDHGNSWNYVEADHNTGGATAEAQIVEMPDGSLKTYLRTGSGYIAEVTSIDGGETWSDRVPLTEIATTSYGTQLSVINYSQPIDGKPAIILSAPNATNGRKNGKIWIGLINETGQSGVNKYSVEWKYCYSVDTPQMGYSYSCLTELPDGKVGLLYEKYDSWSRNELHLKNILKYEKFTIDELKVQP